MGAELIPGVTAGHALLFVAIGLVFRFLRRVPVVYVVARLPGTFAHELLHYLVGWLLGAKPVSLSIRPYRTVAGRLIYGRVEFAPALVERGACGIRPAAAAADPAGGMAVPAVLPRTAERLHLPGADDPGLAVLAVLYADHVIDHPAWIKPDFLNLAHNTLLHFYAHRFAAYAFALASQLV